LQAKQKNDLDNNKKGEYFLTVNFFCSKVFRLETKQKTIRNRDFISNLPFSIQMKTI